MSNDLNNRMEFDHVVRVHADGSVTDESGVYAPELFGEELDDGTWALMNGYSGQYGYSGPIMHASEFIGGGMARDILAAPGLYVALVSYVPTDDEDNDEDNISGWAVAYRSVVTAKD
jgi:hypothetical protein